MDARTRWQVAPDRGLVVPATCDHLPDLPDLPERATGTAGGCEECLLSGGTWVGLRQCLTCGHVGCCDSSPGQHAHRHAHGLAGHHIARSTSPGEDWAWCYTDEVFLRPA